MTSFSSEHFDIQNTMNRKTFRNYGQAFFEERKYSMVPCEFPPEDKYPLYYKAERKEYTIKEGEMLYIPAGWFHFVFSEDVDPKTNLNFAVNFWYANTNFVENGKSNDEKPKVVNHFIEDVDPMTLYEGVDNIRIFRCKKGKMFPSDRLWRHHSKDTLSTENMSFQEFYETKNPEYYILQYSMEKLNEYAPLIPKKKLTEASTCVNFGGVYSHLHYDLTDNWLCQIQGKKRVILFPPEERDKLYLYNTFPLEFSHTFQVVALGDQFIRRNQTSFSPYISTTKDIEESFMREFDSYTMFLVNLDCSPAHGTKELKPQFKQYQGTGVAFPRDEMNIPYSMLWFLTEGTLQIRDYIFNVNPGEFFIFPNNMLYPFVLDKAKVLYPYIDDGSRV